MADKIRGKFEFTPNEGVTIQQVTEAVDNVLAALGSEVAVYSGGSDDQPPH